MADRKNAPAGRLWTLCPWSGEVTVYDREHLTLYARLLDACAEGANPLEMARVIFGLDVTKEQDRAIQIAESHLARAIWMLEHGYPALNW
jgi:hypothetical protein